MKSAKQSKETQKEIQKDKSNPLKAIRTLGPVSDLERHLPADWWRTLFNSIYLKTDGDVVENDANTQADIDLLIASTGITPGAYLLDVCCGQGRHALELARRGFRHIHGVDRSRYLIRLARKRAKEANLKIQFSEGDARKVRLPTNSRDCVFLMGNSFGYFEREEDDRNVLACVRRILKSGGMLVLDIVDGEWMANHFEARSWEWIDNQYFVNRERTLSADKKRIVTREVVTNTEIGVIADQFYAERLYHFDEIAAILKELGFKKVKNAASVESKSTRGQDLGMMAHRLFITSVAQKKKTVSIAPPSAGKRTISIIMGDHRLPDTVKKNGQFNQEDFDTIQKLKDALAQLPHYQTDYLDNHKMLIKQLLRHPPQFVLNLCDEGFNNDATQELHIPAILEMLKIPYSGAAPGCLALCYNKAKVHAIASSMDVPVPLETYFDPSDQAANIPSAFPALLKPVCGDSSIGITQNAVVHNAKELVDYLNYLRENFPGTGILVQEFLQGNEYSVGVIGNQSNLEALPVLEVDYSKLPENLPKILSYESKWHPDSPYWTAIQYQEADIDEELRNRLVTYSRLLFERLECRDYARFDFRCDSSGTPKLLEVNPNPGWCWDGKLNLMAGYGQLSYADLLDKIIKAALERTDAGYKNGEANGQNLAGDQAQAET